MNTLAIILFIVLILVIAFMIYIKFNYTLITKTDQQLLNSSFSFLDDNYLNKFINDVNNGLI